MNHKSVIIRGTNGEYFLQSLMHNPNGKGCISVSSKSSASLGSSNESSSEMEAQSSDLDLCQPYAQSSSSGYSDQQTSTSDEEKSGNLILDTTADCIQQINGSVTLSLMEAKLWYTFLGLGTEMIINKTGRRMFPYLEFSLRGVDPVGLYDVIFDIIPASSKSFKFLNNKWIPMGRKEEEFKNYPFKHPDSPRVGSDWMTRKISFEKIKLSNKPGTKAGIFTLHTLQKYLVRISIVKHERDDELSVVEFPIRATTFIAVTAYNNREVTKLKINSNPYSKGFRFPMKRTRNQSFDRLATTSDEDTGTVQTLRSHIVSYPKTEDTGTVQTLRSPIVSYPKTEVTAISEFPLDLSIQKSCIYRNKSSPQTKEMIDKATQTDLRMIESGFWNQPSARPYANSLSEMTMQRHTAYPIIHRSINEQDTCDVKLAAKKFRETTSSSPQASLIPNNCERSPIFLSNSSDHCKDHRGERLMEYNARIEMWKRDGKRSRYEKPDVI